MFEKISLAFFPSQGYPFQTLQMKKNGLTLYAAGFPLFRSVFTRDSILSGILASDAKMLHDQLVYNALYQGKEKNPITGEEPGKIFHQLPGKRVRGLSTMYNACDTTALFLIGHEIYQQLTGDRALAQKQKKSIEKASEYILSHLQDDLFTESPTFAGALKFALRVTYWKDSAIPERPTGEPEYPVVYTLAHVKNLRGLRSAAVLLQADVLYRRSQKMLRALDTLWDENLGTFIIARDQKGSINGVSSDSLQTLFYLNTKDITNEKIARIVKSSAILETPFGYRTLDPQIYSRNNYHTRTIWPFENALIHAAAVKFDLPHVQEVSSRIAKHMRTYPELFIHKKNGSWKKGGDRLQLWTIAAKKYFDTHA